MRPSRGLAGKGIVVLAALLAVAGCASAPGPASPGASAPGSAEPSAPDPAIARASDRFSLGREAALSGDIVCARHYFGEAIDAVRPAGGPAVSGAMLAFSYDLYESIQRYEALAGATEEAGTSHGQVAPELAAIEAPEATPEEISTAGAEVATAMPMISSDVPLVVNDAVLRVLAAFQSDALHDKIAAGLARSGRYVPMIERIFAEEGLPRDLAMIAFIESSFLPRARSPRSAQGIWQFMPRTGRQYGLRSNGVVDERSDPEKATRAAARYLSYLKEIFGDWYLAMAAYNAGEGKILRAMEKTGARDFWQLASTSAIRRQTQNYVPAFLASLLISKGPSHYGFDVVLESPIEYDTVRLDRSVDIRSLAQGAGFSIDEFQALNPELRSAVTPLQAEGYELRIPPGARESVLVAFVECPTVRPPSFQTHVARKGETLPRIAKRYGVSLSALASANSLSARSKVSRGQEILIPVKVAAVPGVNARKAKTAQTKVAQAAGPAKKSYRVKDGDTLYRIALRHGVTVAEILAVNSLGGELAIRPGDRLKLPARSK